MTKSTITRERIAQIANPSAWVKCTHEEVHELARIALAAMDSEPVEMPIDYLQGHKDGLEWAAQLAEANHPETGDWLYDDPIELAKAIRKGPDMPPAQPVADSEPVAWTWQHLKQWYVTNDVERARELARDGVKVEQLYRHAQQPVVPEDIPDSVYEILCQACGGNAWMYSDALWNACRATMLAAAQHDTPALNSVQSVVTVPGKWIPVSERMPEDRTQVILWDAEIGEVTSGHYSHKTHTFYHCGDAIENEITHWMAPPAATREV